MLYTAFGPGKFYAIRDCHPANQWLQAVTPLYGEASCLVQVLCASNEAHDKVEPVLVPEGVPVGEKVSFEGFDGPPEAVLNPKKKLWEKIAPDLRINQGTVPDRYYRPVSPDNRQLMPWC